MLLALARVVLSSAATSFATTAAVALLSKRDTGRPAAGINAISHIAWGDEAGKHDDVDVKHTVVGALLNVGAMVSWALVGELLPRPRTLLGAARNGVLVSGLAYVTDYYIVPRRLNPGFEQRLSKRSLFETYAVLAGSYALSAALTRQRG